MGYLVVRVATREDVDLAKVSTRAALSEGSVLGSGWPKLVALLEKNGFEVRHPIGPYNAREWPLTAFAYTSMNKEGRGRSGSSLYRLPCRKKP